MHTCMHACMHPRSEKNKRGFNETRHGRSATSPRHTQRPLERERERGWRSQSCGHCLLVLFPSLSSLLPLLSSRPSLPPSPHPLLSSLLSSVSHLWRTQLSVLPLLFFNHPLVSIPFCVPVLCSLERAILSLPSHSCHSGRINSPPPFPLSPPSAYTTPKWLFIPRACLNRSTRSLMQFTQRNPVQRAPCPPWLWSALLRSSLAAT